MGPKTWRKAALAGEPKNRWFVPPAAGGWSQPVIGEWQLTGESWTDEHVHDEYAYVLEGVLFVECDGVTTEAAAGDLVCVPGGSVGRYWAPDYARMLSIYAPNPEGAPMTRATFEKLGPVGRPRP